MHANTLGAFRHDVYPCFKRAGDVLMNTCDALLSEPQSRSFVELSLSPFFTRKWPSLYEGMEDGRIDRKALRKQFVAYAPLPPAGRRWVMGIDASSIYRPLAVTSRDRTAQYVHNLSGPKPPVKAGWSFSALVLLPEEPSSWTYVLDNLRIESHQTPAGVAGAQLRAILPLLKERRPQGQCPLLLGDRYYGSAAFLQELHALKLQGLEIDGLLRIQSHRVLYRPAPPRTDGPGAPKKDGERFKGTDPSTHGEPDVSSRGADEKGRAMEVAGWKDLHFKACREVSLWVYRVTRPRATGTKRDPKVSWFIGFGKPLAAGDVPLTYRLRFSQEHGYRFDKGPLLWNGPHLRSPEAFQRWTDLVAVAHDQLVLARPLAQVVLRPWESEKRSVTPGQVRRAMGKILGELGTPAALCQPRGYSPGRAERAEVKSAERFPVVHKEKKRNTSPRSKARPKDLPNQEKPPKPPSSPAGRLSDWVLKAIRTAASLV